MKKDLEQKQLHTDKELGSQRSGLLQTAKTESGIYMQQMCVVAANQARCLHKSPDGCLLILSSVVPFLVFASALYLHRLTCYAFAAKR